MIKYGVFNTTKKQTTRAFSGKHRIRLNQKMHALLAHSSKPHLSFFDHEGTVYYKFLAQG